MTDLFKLTQVTINLMTRLDQNTLALRHNRLCFGEGMILVILDIRQLRPIVAPVSKTYRSAAATISIGCWGIFSVVW